MLGHLLLGWAGGGKFYLKVWHIIYRWKVLELLYLACELEIERRSLVEEKTQKKSLGVKMRFYLAP